MPHLWPNWPISIPGWKTIPFVAEHTHTAHITKNCFEPVFYYKSMLEKVWMHAKNSAIFSFKALSSGICSYMFMQFFLWLKCTGSTEHQVPPFRNTKIEMWKLASEFQFSFFLWKLKIENRYQILIFVFLKDWNLKFDVEFQFSFFWKLKIEVHFRFLIF